jgi:hypothetical protein
MEAKMKIIEVQEFVRRFKDLAKNKKAKFCFFLGAGCSISSGIPAAGTLIDKEWLPKLKEMETGNEENFDKWLENKFPEYNKTNSAQSYGEIIESRFPTSKERQTEIERLVNGKYPGFCYAIFAKLIENYEVNCNIILTTNFDDMIADALYLYTYQRQPIVIFHEALAAFVKMTDTRPMVIKLHGDSKLFPLNTNDETKELGTEFKKVVKNLFSEKGLIFIGYGGNDNSINSILAEIPINEGFFPWGIYWVGKNIKNKDMEKFLEERNAIWVNHTDFDELMLLMKEELELELPTIDNFKVLFDNLSMSLNDLTSVVHVKPESEAKELLETATRKASKELMISTYPNILQGRIPPIPIDNKIFQNIHNFQSMISSINFKISQNLLDFQSMIPSINFKISQNLLDFQSMNHL